MSESSASLEERIASHFGEADVSENVSQEQPQVEATEEPDPTEEQPEQESAPETEAPSPFEEVEFQGQKYQVPPEIKNALMAQSDYTSKTSDLARTREALTLQQQEVALFQEQRAFQDSVSEEMDNLRMLDAYIQHQRSNANWAEMGTDQIVRARLELEQLGEQRQKLAETLQQKQRQFNERISSERKKLMDSGSEMLQKSIPGWSDDVRAEVEKSLADRGYPEYAVKNMTPLDYQVAWEAAQYRRLQAGKAESLKKASGAPPIVKAGPTNPMPKDVKDKLQFQKDLKKARANRLPEGQTAQVIEKRLEQKFKRFL